MARRGSRRSSGRAVLAFIAGCSLVLGAACLEAWKSQGPWSCSSDRTCPDGYVCDDGLCCQRDGDLGCPTLPTTMNGCRGGEKAVLYYEDRDGDLEGNDRVSQYLCSTPKSGGWVIKRGDCDDTNASTNTSSPEECNGKNDNCDVAGDIDEGWPRRAFYRDQDGDGYGVDGPGRVKQACVAPAGYVELAGDDCGEFSPSKHPNVLEQCNGVDDDCDSVPDSAETVFSDVDDGTSSRFPCDTGLSGECAPGTFQCLAGQRTCVQRKMPAYDGCDQLDNDCDGTADESPDCAGPPQLFANGQGLVRGVMHASTVSVADQNAGCLKGHVNMTSTGGWNDGARVWTASDVGDTYQLWYVEAPGLTTWDLSRQNLKLRMNFTGSPLASFGSPSRFRNPVIYLCGDQPGELIRYVATTPVALGTGGGGASLDSTFVLAADPAWIIGRGSGFDTTKVRRVEVLISSAAPFTLTFDVSTGFVR